jgi:hypothetical protein
MAEVSGYVGLAPYVPIFSTFLGINEKRKWDDRLLTLDPVSLAHVLKHSTMYEKPWQSRRLITGLIGCGMLAAEGQVHKRQRRVATPAFSIQNLKALVPVIFRKGEELKDRWMHIIEDEGIHSEEGAKDKKVRLDVCRWISRATFDVIGLAGQFFYLSRLQVVHIRVGFDYHFNAIQNEDNELFNAYKEMFEVAISQTQGSMSIVVRLYFPILNTLYVSFPCPCNRISRLTGPQFSLTRPRARCNGARR